MSQTAMTTDKIPPGLSANHFDALIKRGLTLETIRAAKLKSVVHDDIKSILGFSPTPGPEARRLGLCGSPGIGIPFFDPSDPNKLRLSRFRLDYPAEIVGKPARYVSPKGAGNLIYFPPGCSDKLHDVTTPVIAVEGEFKVLPAYQAGLFAVGLIGVYGWRTRGIDGQSETIADFNLISWKGRPVIIVFDSDVTTNPQVQRARHELGKELYRRGALVYAIDLPAAPDGSKQGLDDFLLHHSLEAFQQLDVFELPPTDLAPFTKPISSLLQGPMERIEWGIERILPRDGSGWRIAAPKTAKSWDMVEECYCLSTAQPLYRHFRVPQRRRVLVIEEEDPQRRLQHRLRRIIHAHGGIIPSDDFFRYSVKVGFRIDDPKWQEVLTWEIKNFLPEYVYLDVFNRCHSLDIKDSQQMSSIVLFLDGLTRDYGCSFCILHHDRKNSAGGDDHNEIMGSRVLGGWAEASLFFHKTKERGVLRVKVSLKDEPEDGNFEPEFQIRLRDTDDGQGTFFEYLGAPPERQASVELREKIKELVLSSDHGLKIKEIAESIGCAKTTAQEHLEVLFDLKIIGRLKVGQAWTYLPPTPHALNGGVEHDF